MWKKVESTSIGFISWALSLSSHAKNFVPKNKRGSGGPSEAKMNPR
jgi:hypothetical protein